MLFDSMSLLGGADTGDLLGEPDGAASALHYSDSLLGLSQFSEWLGAAPHLQSQLEHQFLSSLQIHKLKQNKKKFNNKKVHIRPALVVM